MKKTTTMKYSIKSYDELAFAVAHYGTSYHRQLWDFCIDAGLSKRFIFTKYMKIMQGIHQSTGNILKSIENNTNEK